MTASASLLPFNDDDLVELLEWLHRQATGRLSSLPGVVTLQTTALVNEAFIRLLRKRTLERCQDRAYRFAAASRAIREAYATAVRSRSAQKRGGDLHRIDFLADVPSTDRQADFADLHEAIELLGESRPRAAVVVDLKFIAGCNIQQIADLLQVSDTTVETDWRFAKEFILRTLTS